VHIVHVITGFDRGGAENQILEQSIEGKKLFGWHVDLVYLQGSGELSERAICNGIGVKRMGLGALVWLLRLEFVVVNCHLPRAEFVGAILKFFSSKSNRYISTKHNDERYFRYEWLDKLAQKFLASRFEHCIFISQAVSDFYRKMAGLNGTTIHYGVRVTEMPSPIRRSSGVRFLFLGRFVHQKNLFFLLKAFRRFLDERTDSDFASLSLVGDGELKQALVLFAEQNRLIQHVSFFPRTQDVDKFINENDVLVLPSLFEGFGLVLLESMVKGKSVIGSNVSAIPEVLGEDGECGYLFSPTDINSCVRAMKSIARPETYRTLGLAGRHRVEKHFSLVRAVTEYNAVVTRLSK
jgi:glycosyltransferase involved in cell wall biosynthesis